MLLLTPAGADFGDQSRELALWLGSQAAVALENVRLHRLVERQASTDGLTDLANRRHFEEALAAEISRAERFGGTIALVLADLDDFKQVNDQYGHQTGDDVLRAFADILRETVRDIDMAARYGGEEFAVLLPQTDLDGAERLAERVRETMSRRRLNARSEHVVQRHRELRRRRVPERPQPPPPSSQRPTRPSTGPSQKARIAWLSGDPRRSCPCAAVVSALPQRPQT